MYSDVQEYAVAYGRIRQRAITYYSILQYGSFRKFGVPYSRVLTLRILLLRVLY